MRTAEEYLSAELELRGCTNDHLHIAAYSAAVRAVKQAQKEAYNQAIRDSSAKRPKKDNSWGIFGDKYYVSSESILKLLK